ncbi:glycosyltransferase family 2 protein [Chloroflexota bacterium]
MKPSTTIIVPAYNEEKGLPTVLEEIFHILDDNYEVIVVDDGSSDSTSEIASNLPCKLIKHEVNKGKGQALRTGFAQAQGEKIIWIDADGTYPVQFIPKMAEELNIYDIVVCSRRYGRENIPRFNRIGNWLFRVLIQGFYGYQAFDPCSGLYGAKKYHLDMMRLSSSRFAIEPEISMKAGRMKLKTLDIPIEYRNRIGQTNLNAIVVGFEDLFKIMRLLLWRPRHNSGR